MSSDVEIVRASQGPPRSRSLTQSLAAAGTSKSASQSQSILLDASSSESDEDLPPALPEFSSLTTRPKHLEKGKNRALVSPELSSNALDCAGPQTSTKATSTRGPGNKESNPLKRSNSGAKSAGEGSTKVKKARLGADGLTAAERRERKAAETEARKQFKTDNKKLVGRKAALSEMVITATDACQRNRYFKGVFEGLQDDIHLSEDEGKYQPGRLQFQPPPAGVPSDAAMITYERASNKYLDPTTSQFKRYADGQVHSTPDKHVVYLLHASDLDSLVGRDALRDRIHDLKRAVGCPIHSKHDPEWKFIMVVQGLAAYARSQKSEASSSAGSGGRRLCSYAQLDETLTRLTVLERVFLIRSESAKDTQRWLFELSIDVAYRPYKILDRTPIESLGIDGTSKGKANASGNDKGLRTTYLSMLASMHQITDGQAESIARAYPTFQQLMSAFEAQATQKDKERMLVGLPMIRNKDGAQTSREIGKDTSKRVYLQLFGRDPHLSMQTMKGI